MVEIHNRTHILDSLNSISSGEPADVDYAVAFCNFIRDSTCLSLGAEQSGVPWASIMAHYGYNDTALVKS